jgi:hypothetical protein
MPGLHDVLTALFRRAWLAGDDMGELRAQVLERLMDLAAGERVAQRVQRGAWSMLAEIRRLYDAGEIPLASIEQRRQAAWERPRLDAFFDDPRAPRPARALAPIPPGAPIGSWCGVGFASERAE